jgi:hypothetical protein
MWTPDQVRGDGLVPVEAPRAPADERRDARWNAALASFQAAEAAVLAASSTDGEARFDRLGRRFEAALRGLLRAPAPHLAALAAKLDLAFEHEVFTLAGGEACLRALRRDAHRLSAAQG